MCKHVKILVLILVLLVGSIAYAEARSRHGGRPGGFHRGGHSGFRSGGSGHRHFAPRHKYGHVYRSYRPFYGDIFFDVSPLWIAPAPYIGVMPVPPPPPAPVWYYCSDPPGYYPAVSECLVPWTPVAPSG